MYDVRRDCWGNEDLEFYDCWGVAIDEAKASANVNNDMWSAWDEYDAWYVSDARATNHGARPVHRSVHSSRVQPSSGTFATSAFRHSKQNFATPVQAPKRHKVSSRPSLASVVNANTTRGNTTQQSEVSAVLLSVELEGTNSACAEQKCSHRKNVQL